MSETSTDDPVPLPVRQLIHAAVQPLNTEIAALRAEAVVLHAVIGALLAWQDDRRPGGLSIEAYLEETLIASTLGRLAGAELLAGLVPQPAVGAELALRQRLASAALHLLPELRQAAAAARSSRPPS